jgi:hypothetical protein
MPTDPMTPAAETGPARLLELIANGAVLEAAVAGGARMLLAPCAKIINGRLAFYDLAAGRARILKFDVMDWEGAQGVWLIQAGDRVACVTSVGRESSAAVTAWQWRWLDNPREVKSLMMREFQAAIDALDDRATA